MSYSPDRFVEYRFGRADQSVWDRPYRCFRLPRNRSVCPTASVWVTPRLLRMWGSGHHREATGGACPPLGSHPNTLKFESSFFDPITNWEKGFGTVDGVIVL